MSKTEYFYALGRRKSSTARVRLYAKGKGQITVNNKSVEEYFDNSQALLKVINKPFVVLDKENQFDIGLIGLSIFKKNQINFCHTFLFLRKPFL